MLEPFSISTPRIVENAKKFLTTWRNEETVVSTTNVIVHIVKRAISLLKEDRTSPFVARFRREEIEALLPDKLALSNNIITKKYILSRLNSLDMIFNHIWLRT